MLILPCFTFTNAVSNVSPVVNNSKVNLDDATKVTSEDNSCSHWNAPKRDVFGELTHFSPAKGLLRIFEDLQSTFSPPSFRLASFNPSVPLDVKETENHYEIVMDAPGL